MSSSQQQTTQVATTAQVTAQRRRGVPRRNNSGILSRRNTNGTNAANGLEGVAALPVKRRGSYQQLKKTVVPGGDGGEQENINVGPPSDPTEVASSVGSADEVVQILDSPELKQTHWEQFGTAQVVLFSVDGNEELLSFYDQALSAEGYDTKSIEEIDELSCLLKNQKVEPDLLLFLSAGFAAEEYKTLINLRSVGGHTPVMIVSTDGGDKELALEHATEFLSHSEDDIDDLVVKINKQLRKRHQAKLQIESMIEQAQRLLTKASLLKRTTLFTLSEEEAEGSDDQQKQSTLLTQRHQVQQVLSLDPKLRNQAVNLVQLLDKESCSWDVLVQDSTLKCDLLALKQLL